MASSVTGTDKFLQLVPIFSPRPTMSGIFHKFGSISTLAAPRRKPMETELVSCLEDNNRLSLNKYLHNNVRKTPGNVDQTPITEAPDSQRPDIVTLYTNRRHFYTMGGLYPMTETFVHYQKIVCACEVQ